MTNNQLREAGRMPSLEVIQSFLVEGRLSKASPWLGDLLQSKDIPHQLMGARLLRTLGGERAAEARMLRLGRNHPDDGDAVARFLRTLLEIGGPFRFWHASQNTPLPAHATDVQRAEVLTAQAMALASLRDFDRAQVAHAQAIALAPDDYFHWLDRAFSYRHADDLAGAESAIAEALARYPRSVSAQTSRARLLMQLRAYDEAYELLQGVASACDSPTPLWPLLDLALDASDGEAALRWLDELGRRLLHADPKNCALLAARRADAMLLLGRDNEACLAAKAAAQWRGWGYYQRLADQLEAHLSSPHPGARKVLLSLDYVGQHQMTCAPATLATLCQYWGLAAEHLEIAQEICYDGTNCEAERRWAEQQGLWVREFSVDAPTAFALIDAGLPFALNTESSGTGHLQAVVGYQRPSGTLLVRDPMMPLHTELSLSACDPGDSPPLRGLLLLPPQAQSHLAGISLPDEAAWTAQHEVAAALERHDRVAAERALDSMREQYGGHWLLQRAERMLAHYDGDEPRLLAATDAMLDLFPGYGVLQHSRLTSLMQVQGQQAADDYLAELVRRPGADPLLMQRWAETLARDARLLPQAYKVLRRALWRAPSQSRLWNQWAAQLWQEGRWRESIEPYRWASTLEPTSEWLAEGYARACQFGGKLEEGVEHLRERERRWGDRRSDPAITLVNRLSGLDRDAEADAALVAGLQRRDQDADLRLFHAERLLRQQRHEAAWAVLQDLRGKHREPARLRLQAEVLEQRGELSQAIDMARRAVRAEPLALSGHRLLLRLLARLLGRKLALQDWRTLADAHPAHFELQRLLYEWLQEDPREAWKQLARMQAHHPGDTWLMRERALVALRLQRFDEAIVLAQNAVELAPKHAASLSVLGECLLRGDGYAAAQSALHAAICLDVDLDRPRHLLLENAPDPTTAGQAVDAISAELRVQAQTGDALLAFQDDARRAWAPEQLLGFLYELRELHPHLWHAEVALARQLREMGRQDDAFAILEAAVERFASLPRIHWEFADALRGGGLRAEAMSANAKGLTLSPGWNRAVRMQVELIESTHRDWAQALKVVDAALHSAWEDEDLMGLRAWILEQLGGRDDELGAQARLSLLRNPAEEWVWGLVRRACERAEDWTTLHDLVDEVATSRPGDAEAWLVQAQQLDDDERALAAAEQALDLMPLHLGAWEARFRRLERLGRTDELLCLLDRLPFPTPVPLTLRAWRPRLAWRSGDAAGAIALQAQLVAEAPEVGQLVALADWCDESDDHDGYLNSSRQLVAQDPLKARSHAYLGHALLKSGRVAEAVKPLQHALQIEPNYSFAVRTLVEASGKAGCPADAEAPLDALWSLQPTVQNASLGIESACASRDSERALAWFERLLGLTEYEVLQSRAAVQALVTAGWWPLVSPRLVKHLRVGGGPAGVGLAWLEQQPVFWIAWLRALHWLRDASQPHLLRALIRWLKDTDSRTCFSWLVLRHAAALKSDSDIWGEVSYALLSFGKHGAVRSWTDDWSQRDRPPVWAMCNRCGALAELGDWRALDAVIDATLPRAPLDADLRFWQLVQHAWREDLEALQAAWSRRHEWSPESWMGPGMEAFGHFMEAAQGELRDGTTLKKLRSLRNAAREKGLSEAVLRLLESQVVRRVAN